MKHPSFYGVLSMAFSLVFSNLVQANGPPTSCRVVKRDALDTYMRDASKQEKIDNDCGTVQYQLAQLASINIAQMVESKTELTAEQGEVLKEESIRLNFDDQKGSVNAFCDDGTTPMATGAVDVQASIDRVESEIKSGSLTTCSSLAATLEFGITLKEVRVPIIWGWRNRVTLLASDPTVPKKNGGYVVYRDRKDGHIVVELASKPNSKKWVARGGLVQAQNYGKIDGTWFYALQLMGDLSEPGVMFICQ